MTSYQPKVIGQTIVDLLAAGSTHEQLGRVVGALACKHPMLDDESYGKLLADIATANVNPSVIGSFVVLQLARSTSSVPDSTVQAQTEKAKKRKYTIAGKSSMFLREDLVNTFIAETSKEHFRDLSKKMLAAQLEEGMTRSMAMEAAMTKALARLSTDNMSRRAG